MRKGRLPNEVIVSYVTGLSSSKAEGWAGDRSECETNPYIVYYAHIEFAWCSACFGAGAHVRAENLRVTRGCVA